MSDPIEKLDPKTIAQMAMLKDELGGGKEYDREGKIAMILSYIKAHAGELITLDKLAAAAGYSTGTSAGPAIQKLVRDGRIMRRKLSGHGRGYHFTYYIRNTESIGRQNGPAVSNFFEEVEPEVNRKKREQQIKELDYKAWEFIKQHDWKDAVAMGYGSSAIIGFLEYLKK